MLVVDDQPENLELVAEILSEEGYRIQLAHDGESALAMVAAEQPDCIVLDVMMPRLDGFAVCRRLKGDERTRDLPIVVLTAKAMDRDDRERLHGKIEALVHKTDCSPARLEAVLRDVVRRQLRAAGTADA